ncbi:SusC/RagA family TonB-linked outer membrane protein [Paraflavitalea soli]|uniref:SusC/RagA family TonB-linked outer membrane protein n=1 Tax=Paraflavitalea soli TaxID=2315862 RepID=A0A3B7MN40_9BACT|nr:SusC/RagA family TonB-linked outer membrane protein [Paraflavitalea soli]AXY74779.1 SusC/RagA family TonB-linked outer membrane protein [Paraflavitalea soli]
MKSKLLVLTVGTLLLAVKGHAQKTITRTFINAPLETVIRDISDSAGLTCATNAARFRKCSPVTINFTKVEVYQALEDACKKQPVSCRIEQEAIIVEPRDVKGRITDERGEPLANITVVSSGSNKHFVTRKDGRFTLYQAALDSFFDVSAVNYESQHIILDGSVWFNLILKEKVTIYGDSTGVTVCDGYNRKPRERATGSFGNIGLQQLIARPSPTLGPRLDGLVPGMVVFNTDIGLTSPLPAITIRGVSTLLANAQPLFVVDRFPYDGNLNQLNPNDIECITILKDAAASSIWGARAGNGVIVITTRQGKHNQGPRLSFSTQLTLLDKYNSRYLPLLGAASTLSLEDSFFHRGYYDVALLSGFGSVPPGAEILEQLRLGMIDSTKAASLLQALAGHDVRDDLDKYYYRRTTAQQYHLSLEGGDTQSRYYLSAGYDKINNGLTQGTQYRYSITSNYSYKPRKTVEINLGAALNQTGARNDIPFPGIAYTYAMLANPDGTAAVVNRDRPQVWKDTQVLNGMPDWSYRPLDELSLRDDSLHRLQTRLFINLAYTVVKGLKLQIAAQNLVENTTHTTRYPIASYAYRDLYNNFSYLHGFGIASLVPQGPMEDIQQTHYRATNIRGQIDYNHNWPDNKWELTAVAGAEIARTTADTSRGRHYSKTVNFDTLYNMYEALLPPMALPGKPYTREAFDYFRSYFAIAGLALHGRYMMTGSFRIDQSNFFGARTNALTQPLWSAGMKWRFTNEPFINISWLSEASLRTNFGLSGNIDKSLSALLTTTPPVINQYGAETRTILNAANPNLQWETSRLFNIGLDFQFSKKRFSGTVEYYRRFSKDLLNNEITRTTAGATPYRNNSAALRGHGVELQLNVRLPLGKCQYNGSLLLAYTTNKVIHTDTSKQKAIDYLDPSAGNLLVGRPSDALYALHKAPLDPANGDPRAYLQGEPSNDYPAILNGPRDSLQYMGHSTPPWTAAISQSISYYGITLSFLLIGRFGYHYRQSSMDYHGFISGTKLPHPDYDNRWQQPGDETRTTVPSFPAIIDPFRDQVYGYSNVLVKKADNIRMREVKLSYMLNEKIGKKAGLSGATIFLYGANLGILWKASHNSLDPDSPSAMPLPKSYSIGLSINL